MPFKRLLHLVRCFSGRSSFSSWLMFSVCPQIHHAWCLIHDQVVQPGLTQWRKILASKLTSPHPCPPGLISFLSFPELCWCPPPIQSLSWISQGLVSFSNLILFPRLSEATSLPHYFVSYWTCLVTLIRHLASTVHTLSKRNHSSCFLPPPELIQQNETGCLLGWL